MTFTRSGGVPKPLAGAVLVAFATLVPERGAHAWSRVGHQTIALISESRLSSGTLTRVHGVLGPGVGLADIAACADNIKRKAVNCAGAFTIARDPGSRGQHYINASVRDLQTPETLMRSCHKPKRPGSCIIDRIEESLSVLRSTQTTRSQKQFALMALVHFVGDLHAPLHVAFDIDSRGKSDGGGNGADIWFGITGEARRPTNLHHLWDNLIETDADLKRTSPQEYASLISEKIASGPVDDWLRVPLIGVALESNRIAKDVIYPAYRLPGGTRVGREYQVQMRPIAQERVAQAGVRLGALIEASLGQ